MRWLVGKELSGGSRVMAFDNSNDGKTGGLGNQVGTRTVTRSCADSPTSNSSGVTSTVTIGPSCADAAAVIDELGGGDAIVFGHDWGAPIAWNTARLHADRVRAVAGLSVPYNPIGEIDPLERWKDVYADRFFYQNYIATPSVAESEVSVDVARSLRLIYYAASGDADRSLFAPKGPDAGLLDDMIDPDPFPAWMSDDDLAVYVDAFESGGWTGPFNRYRAQGLDAAELGPLPDKQIHQPAAFVAGELDGVRNFVPGTDLYAHAGDALTDLRVTSIIPGIGHWVQQEAPAATNAALAEFLDTL